MKREDIKDVYELTPMQSGMLFHFMASPQSRAYYQRSLFSFSGKLNIDLVCSVIRTLIERHEIFRTIFLTDNLKKPVQVVVRSRVYSPEILDYSGLKESGRKTAVEDFCAGDEEKGFNLHRDFPLRVAVIKWSDDRTLLFWSHHHILMDGWCLALVMQEFLAMYHAELNGKPHTLPDPVPFSHYIKWLQKQDRAKAADFWNTYLEGFEEATCIPGYRKEKESCARMAEQIFPLGTDMSRALDSLAVAAGVTRNTVFEGIIGLIFSRFSCAREAVWGKVVSGRPPDLSGVEKIVGLCINTIPVRVSHQGTESFADYLKALQQRSLDCQAFDYFPLWEIQSHNPLGKELIPFILAFENFPMGEELGHSLLLSSSGISLDSVDSTESTNYDFNIIVISGKEVRIIFRYNPERISGDLPGRITAYFGNILKTAALDRMKLTGSFELVGPEEEDQLLHALNNTNAEYPEEKTVILLFEETAGKFPQRTALSWDKETITYSELDRRASVLSRAMTSWNLKPDDLVALVLERGFNPIISILAILKCGAAYLPIEPDLPEERRVHIFKDSLCSAIITDQDIESCSMPILDIRKIDFSAAVSLQIPKAKAGPDNLLYVIYTSGTTGKPKGAMITHRNVVRLLFNSKFQFSFSNLDVWTLFHSYAFDFSVWEMYGALLYGGRLVIVPKQSCLDTGLFLKLLKTEKVTVLNQTPSAFYNLLAFEAEESTPGLSLRYIIFGGEALQPVKLRGFSRKYPDTKLINMYGITETTVHVTYKELSAEDMEQPLSNIGRPIPTLSAYILNQDLRLQPVDAAGELFVGGSGVCRGYLNNPGLTAEKFIPNPYKPEEILYRSGDLVRLEKTGEMSYLGRIDTQVKIRGYRIEPADVAHALLTIPGIANALVLAHTDRRNEKFLVAFLTADEILDCREVKNRLGERLPGYMIPSFYVQIKEIPLTINGKADTRFLLRYFEEQRSEIKEGTEPDLTGQQKRIAALWMPLLGLSRFPALDDDFFVLGGNSISCTQLVLTFNKEFSTAIEFPEFLRNPTLRRMDSHLSMKDTANAGKSFWDDEATLDQHLVFSQPGNFRPEAAPSAILLTGSTGFLGAFLLKEFLSRTNCIVYCPVRSSDDADAMRRIRDNYRKYELDMESLESRIVPLSGDLSPPFIGLTEERFNALSNEIDLICHNASIANFTYSYHGLKGSNVESTRHLIALAGRGKRKRFHYVSTDAVMENCGLPDPYPETWLDNPAYLAANTGYVQTKYVSERLLKNALEKGLFVTLSRPGRITGDTVHGACQSRDLLWQMIRVSCLIGAYFVSNLEFDLVPVDIAAGIIADICRDPGNCGRIYHVYNRHKLNHNQLAGLLSEKGIELKRIPYTDWQTRVKQIAEQNRDSEAAGLLTLLPPAEAMDSYRSRQWDTTNIKTYPLSARLDSEDIARLSFSLSIEFLKRRNEI